MGLTGWHHHTIANNKATLINAGLAKIHNDQLYALRPDGPLAASVRHLGLSSDWHNDLHYLRFYVPSDRKSLDLRQSAIWSLAHSIAADDRTTGPLTASYFAASLGLHRATVQKDIDKLISLGLLVRGLSDRSRERFRLAIPILSEQQLALFADHHSGEEQFIWPADFVPGPSEPAGVGKKPQPALTDDLLTRFKAAIELLRQVNVPDALTAELIEEGLLSGILLKDFQRAIRQCQRLNNPDKFDHCGYLLRSYLRKNQAMLRSKAAAVHAKEERERRELEQAKAALARRQREAEEAFGDALAAPFGKDLILSRVQDSWSLRRWLETYPESVIRQVLSTLPVRGENHEKIEAFAFGGLLRKEQSRQTPPPERTPEEQEEDAFLAELQAMN